MIKKTIQTTAAVMFPTRVRITIELDDDGTYDVVGVRRLQNQPDIGIEEVVNDEGAFATILEEVDAANGDD